MEAGWVSTPAPRRSRTSWPIACNGWAWITSISTARRGTTRPSPSKRPSAVDYTDIYRPARHDSAVPIEETIGAIADLIKAGYVRAIGLSEVGPEAIRRAHAVHPIADLQIEY